MSNWRRQRKTFVLCFDGTGNKFNGNDNDSNILKIFRMLDRTSGQQYHYYQPGIGTYVTSTSFSETGLSARISHWYAKAKDSAVGTSFADHVMGGYKFLMRYYAAGDDIYFFGFSRGAYVARFLAEMLDHVGLLSEGCEELVHFAWKTFAQWQQRQDGEDEEAKQKKEMFEFMRAFRETFSRPVRRIRFLGLFDTVNSVPRFEAAWMQRKKYPYTARSSAKVIRHAVSIDERRAKFRQDLISGDERRPAAAQHQHLFHHRRRSGQVSTRKNTVAMKNGHLAAGGEENRGRPSTEKEVPLRRSSEGVAPEDKAFLYRPRHRSVRPGSRASSAAQSRAPSAAPSASQLSLQHHAARDGDDESDDEAEQSIDEVWFPGCHADIGGGWGLGSNETVALSHVPLVWMVREARRAGLIFDYEKMEHFKCYDPSEPEFGSSNFSDPFIQEPSDLHVPSIHVLGATPTREEAPTDGPQPFGYAREDSTLEGFKDAFNKAASRGSMHDCLRFNNGLPHFSVLSWRMMEYLPFRRMDLQPDGSWKPIRWPLPCGEVRDIPDKANIHNSALLRMQADETYRPGNLIIGGGGRGVKVAPKEYGMGEWKVMREETHPVGKVVRRKERFSPSKGAAEKETRA
ncbi:MAG: hypothetical protein M1833_003856 [Piccolia ochrophora]|nr:MAG: hypothetical protein M1833_003856 [Piccolia ochrophora]